MSVRRAHLDDHVVSKGRVHCPTARRDVSVEACWECERLIEFDVDEKMEIVRCTAERTLAELLPAMI